MARVKVLLTLVRESKASSAIPAAEGLKEAMVTVESLKLSSKESSHASDHSF